MNRIQVSIYFFLIFFLILLNILFIQKEPIYDDFDLKELLNFLETQTDENSIIQTDFEKYRKYVWISPLIRILPKRSIFIDNSYTFRLEDSKEWLIRKRKIQKIKKNIKLHKIEEAFCDLKMNKIDYFISFKKIKGFFSTELLIYNNEKFYVYFIKEFNKISC